MFTTDLETHKTFAISKSLYLSQSIYIKQYRASTTFSLLLVINSLLSISKYETIISLTMLKSLYKLSYLVIIFYILSYNQYRLHCNFTIYIKHELERIKNFFLVDNQIVATNYIIYFVNSEIITTFVKIFLHNMIKPTEEEIKIIERVEKNVCDFFGVTIQSIVNMDRTSSVSMARGFIFYILHYDYKISISKIANTYYRTNRAVFWHVGKIKHLLKQRMHKEIYNSICNK